MLDSQKNGRVRTRAVAAPLLWNRTRLKGMQFKCNDIRIRSFIFRLVYVAMRINCLNNK